MGAPSMKPLWAAFALTPLASRASRLSSGWQPALPTVTGLMPLIVANPTPAPQLPELFRRADSKTCAYIFGVEAGAIVCPAGNTCSTNSIGSVFRCCPTGADAECYMPTACLDYVAYKSGLCQSRGTSTTCCSDSATPYCTVVALVDKPSVSLVGCLNEKTYIGVYANITNPPTSTAIPTTSTTPSPTSSSSSSALPSTSAATQSPSSDSSLPIGPIVGGAVGGLAVLGITAAVIAWLMLRAKRNNNKPQGEGQLPAQQQSPSTGQPVSPYGNSGHLSFASWTQTNESTAGSPGLGGPHPFFKDAVTVTRAQSPPSQMSPVAVAQQQQYFPAQAHGGFQVQPSGEHPQFQPGVYASELPVAVQPLQRAGE